MAVKGVFASDQNIQGTRRQDFASTILQIMPTGSAPLLALSSGMQSKDASDTVVTWFEENHLAGRFTVSGAVASSTSATSVLVLDASFAVAGCVLLVEATGEYLLVNSVSGNMLNVERAFAGSTVGAIGDAGFLQRIGTAFEEGSSRPTAVANLGYPRFNYMQIFRNAWDVTGTARAIEHVTGDVVAKNRADCMTFHSEDIERSLWFGRRSIGVKNGKPFRTMDGILTMITTNVVTEGSSTTYLELLNFLQDVFAKNIKGKPNERIAFCGNTVLNVIDQLVLKQGTMNIAPGQTEFGMKVTKWMTPFGDISLMTHPLFNESPLWTKDLYVLHPGAIRMRYLRRTKPTDYPADQGADGDFGVLTTEMSVEYAAELTGGKFTGIATAGAALT
jgi:hypothetical protein